MNEPEKNSTIVITILFIVGAVIFIWFINYIWRAVYSIHTDYQALRYKQCTETKINDIYYTKLNCKEFERLR